MEELKLPSSIGGEIKDQSPMVLEMRKNVSAPPVNGVMNKTASLLDRIKTGETGKFPSMHHIQDHDLLDKQDEPVQLNGDDRFKDHESSLSGF